MNKNLVLSKQAHIVPILGLGLGPSPVHFLDGFARVAVQSNPIQRRDIRSDIPLRLKEFLRAKFEGSPDGKGVYLTVYPQLSPNTDSISF